MLSVLPDGPRHPRIVQAWLWLKKPTWFLDHCSRAYGDVFTMRLPLGMNLVHVTDPELVKAVFGGGTDVLRGGEANAAVLEPLLGRHSVLVLDGPEHLRQRKLILPAFHGDRMRAWEAAIRDITRAEAARWPAGKPFALRPAMQSITLEVIMRGRLRCRRVRAPRRAAPSHPRRHRNRPQSLPADRHPRSPARAARPVGAIPPGAG